MKSSFLEKSKRALVLLLTGAMIATSVPADVFAAPLADEDVIIEEAVDAVAEDAVVEEEVVADEPSDVVEALGAEEPVEGADTVEADDDGETRKLRLKNTDAQAQTGVTGGAITGYKVIGDLTFKYGVTYNNFSFEAQDFFPTEPATYNGASWTLYKLKDNSDDGNAEFDESNDGGVWKTYMDQAFDDSTDAGYIAKKKAVEDCLDKTATDNDVLPTGIVMSVTNGKLTISKGTAGAPMKASSGYYVLKVADSAVKTNAEIYSNAFKIVVEGADHAASLIDFVDEDSTATVNETHGSWTAGDPDGDGIDFNLPAGMTDNSVQVGTVTFDTKSTNYEVHATKPASLSADKWVKPLTVVLSADVLNDRTAIQNSSYTIKGANGKTSTEFVVTPTDTGLYNGNKVTLTINPKEGLEKTVDNGGLHVAYLCISHDDAYELTHVIRLIFNVETDISLSVKKDGKIVEQYTKAINSGASTPTFNLGIKYYYLDAGEYKEADAAKKAASAATAQCDFYVEKGTLTDPIDLGEVELGKPVDIKFIGAGGGTGLRVDGETETESTADIDGVESATAFDSIDKLAAAGFELVPGDGVSMTLGGAFKIRNGAASDPVWAKEAATLSTITFGIAASDEGGNKEVKYFTLTPKKLDIEITSTDGKTPAKATIGKIDDSNKYTWTASNDTELKDAILTVKVHNPSTVKIKVEAALATDTTESTGTYNKGTLSISSPALVGGKYTIEINPGEDGEFKIKPEAIEELETGADGATAVLLITSVACDETDVVLTFKKASNDVEITEPETGILNNDDKAQIGKAYSYTFKAEASGDVDGPKWYVVVPTEGALTTPDYTVKTGLEIGTDDVTSYYVDFEGDYVLVSDLAPEYASTYSTSGKAKEGVTYYEKHTTTIIDSVTGEDLVYAGAFSYGDDITGFYSSDELKKGYGLSLDPDTGILSAETVVDSKKALDGRGNDWTYTDSHSETVLVPGLPGEVKFCVVAKYWKGGSASYVGKAVTLTVAKPDAPFELTSGSTTMNNFTDSTKNVLDMGSIGLDSGTGKSTLVSIDNKTGVDLNNVEVKITKVDRYKNDVKKQTKTGSDVSKWFGIEFSTNSTVQTDALANGTSIKASASTPFTIKSVPVTGLDTDLVAGDYELTVVVKPVEDSVTILDTKTTDITDDEIQANTVSFLKDTLTFTAKLTVNDTPIIKERVVDVNPSAEVENHVASDGYLAVGEKLASATGFGFEATLTSDPTKQFNITWKNAANAKLDIADSGLFLGGDGYLSTKNPTTGVEGKILKAGIYNVVVMADSKTAGDNMHGEKEFEIIISGDAAVTVFAKGDATDLTSEHTWVMPTQIYGETKTSSVEFTIDTDKDINNVKVTISDAEDDRKAEEIAKNNDNPYAGNAKYFVVDKTAAFNASTSETNTFKISAVTGTGAPVAGRYKAKVTLTGDNMTTRYFYVYLPVVDKLSINQISDAQATVGDPYSRAINAIGADETQSIVWTEIDPTDEEKTRLNPASDEKSITQKTGLSIYGENSAKAIKVETKNGVPQALTGRTTFLGKGSITGLVGDELAPAVAGTFTITVRAFAAKVDLDTSTITTTATGVGKTYLNYTNIIPDQDATMTFDLVVAKTNSVTKAKLTRIGVPTGEVAVPLYYDPTYGNSIIGNNIVKNESDSKWYDQGIVGTLTNNDSQYENYTGYVIKPSTVNYTNDAATDGVTYVIESLAQTEMEVTVELKKGKDSPFDILAVSGAGTWTPSAAPLASKKGTLVMAASTDGTTATKDRIVIVPKDDLEVATDAYTDKLVVSGKNMQSAIELDVSFAVQSATYLTKATYKHWTSKSVDPTVLVADNVLQEDAKISLKTATVDTTNNATTLGNMAREITITNTGNSDINFITVEEVKYDAATGKATALGSSQKILKTSGGSTIALTSENAAAAAGSTGIEPLETITFDVEPTKIDTVGLKQTYVQVSFKGKGDGEKRSYVIPVEYLVVNKDLDAGITIDPSGSIRLDEQNENYADGASKKTITVTNGNEAKPENALDTLVISVEDGFKLASSAADVKGGDTLTFYSVAAGASVSFDVMPVTGLSAKDSYSGALNVNANNFKKSKTSTVTFKVNEDDEFMATIADDSGLHSGTNSMVTEVAPGFTERLYNSLKGAVAKNNTAVLGTVAGATSTVGGVSVTAAGGHIAAVLDMDGNKKADTVVDFTGTTSSVTASAGATITKVGNDKFTLSKSSLELTDAEIAEITKDDQANGTTTPYFNKITLSYTAMILFEVDASADDTVYFTDPILTLKDNTNIILNDKFGDPVTVNEKTKAIEIDSMLVKVPFGQTVGSVVGSAMPEAATAEQAFDSWVFDYPTSVKNKLDALTPVELSVTCTPTWHTHVWPTSATTGNNDVVWTWSGNDTEGYKDPTVTIYCTKTDCPDREGSKKTFTGATSPRVAFEEVESVPATCTKGPRKEYRANLAFDASHIYSDTKSVENGQPLGHSYTARVTWTSAEVANETTGKMETVWTPGVVLTCTQCSEDTDGHTYVVPASGITMTTVETKKATCLTAGEVTYTLVSVKDADGNVIESYASDTEMVKTAVREATGHAANFTSESVVVTPNEDFTKAAVVITCPIDGELFNGNVDLTQDPSNPARYTATVTFANGEKYTVETFTHVHKWSATWSDWTRKSTDDKFSWTTSLTLKCNEGTVEEVETPEVTVTSTADGDKYVDFVATATFDGQTYTSEVFTVDAVTGEPTAKHDHKWSAPSWTWTNKDSATATFTCSVGKETKDVTATIIVAKGPNSKGNTQYKATVTGPDNQEYSDLKWFDASGNPTSGEGIGIELAETEYPYTGAAIKPVFTVVDYSADKVLAEGTDYSVKYTNNNPNPKRTSLPVTATITVTGKGNYAVKDATVTAEFTIFDPMKDEDVTDYAGKVKSVKVTSKDNFAYDGTAKYPQTLLIKTDGGDITATFDGTDGYTLNEGAKDVMIVVTNNINKGSGVVAVTGADKVTKKANFKIAACDLSKLSSEQLSITAADAVYAVKGAKSEVEVTFGSETLVAGKDYTLSWKYSGKKNIGEKAGQVVVKGKGNFTKSAAAVDFNITALDIDKIDNIAVFAGTTPKKVKVTLYDGEGTVIPAKQYTVKVEKDGTDVTADSKTKLKAGDEIDVTVTAVAGANITGDETETGIKVANNLAKVKVTVPKTFTKTYTGEAIELDSDDFGSGKITVGTLEYGTDFEIVGYQNNIKKGTMTVFIQGISENASGMGKIKVKIDAKKMVKAE